MEILIFVDIEFQCHELEIEILWIGVLKPRIEILIFVEFQCHELEIQVDPLSSSNSNFDFCG